MQDFFVKVNGIDVHYVKKGSGPPVLLIHGLGEFFESWMFNIDGLSSEFTVYAMDLPGHGLSEEWTDEYNIESGTRFLYGFMEAVGIDKAVIVGHSLGGPMTVGLAVRHPEKVEKLVLVNSGGFDDHVSMGYRLATVPVLGRIMLGPRQIFNRKTIRFGMRRQFFNAGAVPEAWVEAACTHFRRPNRNSMLMKIIRSYTGLRGIKKDVTILNLLPEIHQPVLIVHGENDNVVPVEKVREACRLIDSAAVTIFNECGHNPHIEKSSEFNEAVASFLRNGHTGHD